MASPEYRIGATAKKAIDPIRIKPFLSTRQLFSIVLFLSGRDAARRCSIH